MTGDRAIVIFLGIALLAVLGWKVADTIGVTVVTPPEPQEDSPPVLHDEPAVINLANGMARPRRTVYGRYMLLPPMIPWASEREAKNGC